MNSISAAIVILAGTGCFVGGAFVRHGDTSTFVMFAGACLAILGVVMWFLTFKRES